jgi:hypothetical protein
MRFASHPTPNARLRAAVFRYNAGVCRQEHAMSAITFDTHEFVRRLKEAGFDEKQAEGLTEAMRTAITESELVTRRDLQIELAPLKADLNLLKWMMGALIALAIANFSKQFF